MTALLEAEHAGRAVGEPAADRDRGICADGGSGTRQQLCGDAIAVEIEGVEYGERSKADVLLLADQSFDCRLLVLRVAQPAGERPLLVDAPLALEVGCERIRLDVVLPGEVRAEGRLGVGESRRRFPRRWRVAVPGGEYRRRTGVLRQFDLPDRRESAVLLEYR
ncbi:MAG: hypothetical protein U5O39_11545 [Gammaproteobacteria bacterium]|nr:hypothetical protein [Gammaproteobacteria bacterium]